MSDYQTWAKQLWDIINKLQGDNLDYEDMVNGLATALQAGIEDICGDCEWNNNCDNCEERRSDEPSYNEGYL